MTTSHANCSFTDAGRLPLSLALEWYGDGRALLQIQSSFGMPEGTKLIIGDFTLSAADVEHLARHLNAGPAGIPVPSVELDTPIAADAEQEETA